MHSIDTDTFFDYETLMQHQLEGLQMTLNRVYKNVEYYHRLFNKIGLVPENISSLDDLRSIPYTTKEILRENYPYGMFALPLSEIVKVHSSAGTTGKPTIVGFNRNDMRHWREAGLRVLKLAGVTPDDIVQVAFGSSFFTGGSGLHLGVEELGATLISTSSVDLERHAFMIRDYHVTTLISTPCYALSLIETFESMGMSGDDIPLKKGLFGGEPWSENLRSYIEEKLAITAYDHYGLSEIFGSGIAAECECRSGLHIFEDQVIPEVIDPLTGEVLPDSEVGELVLTTISKEAMPLIRYRTGDLTRLAGLDCECTHGIVGRKMARISSRTDESIEVSGIEISARKIDDVLRSILGGRPRFQVVVSRESTSDIVEIHTEIPEKAVSAGEVSRQELEKTLKENIRNLFIDLLGSEVKILFYPPMGLSHVVEHRTKIIDRRFLKE